MAMNKFMHPRNIYKSPPNFKELALEYPEFRPFVQQDITGKVTLDFKKVENLRALSCVLLKKDFGLDVDIPLTKLIPTIPLRLNYILWIEDLLKLLEDRESVRGIDIGTGASCVYPLLGAKKNNWRFIATEVDDLSIAKAVENVARNNLSELIKVVKIENEDKLIEDIVGEEDFEFCMCNPPFFSSTQELHPFFKSRTKNRPHPKNAFCASDNEVVVKGGEIEYLTRLIKESKILGSKVKIYTTMVGHKSNLPKLKSLLREVGIHSFCETEFCQGNTTRWGLAWTFLNIDLRKVQDPVKQLYKGNKTKQPVIYELPLEDVNDATLVSVSEKLLILFKNLKFTTEEVSRNKNNLRYFVTAYANTWSNQRRKRRAEKRLNSSNESHTSMEEDLPVENNNLSPENHGVKRERDENLTGSLIKKLRLSSEGSEAGDVFFKFVLSIIYNEQKIYLELNCSTETENRDYLYQILQYIKNNLKI